MLGGTGLQDEMLRAYVDKVFDEFDIDRNGSLDDEEMTQFFNKLFVKLGINQQVSMQQSVEAIKSIDQNFDGTVDKKQLFQAFKVMLNKSQKDAFNTQMAPPQYGGGYGPYNPYYPQTASYPGYYPPPPQYGYPPPSYYPPPPYNSQPPPYPYNFNQMYGNPAYYNPMYGNQSYGYPNQPYSQNNNNPNQQSNTNPYKTQ